MELGHFLGRLHPVLVHFPLVLLPLAFVMEAVGFFGRRPRWSELGKATLLLGTAAAMLTFICGNFAEVWAARSGVPQEPIETHENMAIIVSWTFIALSAARLFIHSGRNRATGFFLAGMLVACLGLVMTGYFGGRLVYEHAAGVARVAPWEGPTDEDLAVLAQIQTDSDIAYSQYMHRTSGWGVLILGVVLLLNVLQWRGAGLLQRFLPLLMLAGGVWLMIFSDRDIWPLYQLQPYRSWLDGQVLTHKTLATLLLAAGGFSLWRQRRGAPRAPGRRWEGMDRLIAIFALVGGGLLFTHVHNQAPYANVAVGVYLHHTFMGLLALATGLVKLLEDRFRGRLGKPARLIFPALVIFQGLFLIVYIEDLPWALGYPWSYRRQPPTPGGQIAATRLGRAELLFDPRLGRLDVRFWKKDSDDAVRVPAEDLTMEIQRGRECTAVPLRAADAPTPAGHHRFVGEADFLRGAHWFLPRLETPFKQGRSLMVWDPVVRTQPRMVHPGEWVAYACPNHPNIGSQTPGKCPIDQVDLVVQPLPRGLPPALPLHDPDFAMRLTTTPAPVAGQPTLLRFTPMRNGKVVHSLEIMHTKPLHLLVVSDDLARFEHVHPIPAGDGSLTLRHAFLTGGRYLLFADIKPAGARPQVFRLEVNVAGAAPPRTPLLPSPALAQEISGYRVALRPAPPIIRARLETALVFALSRDGRPVSDLEPYLGAFGHCVAISEDTRGFIHIHPLGAAKPNLEGRTDYGGPTVTFHARFPRPGLYKVWAQFQRRGQVITAPFVVRVRSRWTP